MSVRKLDKIFDPQRIAVIGVSMNPNSVGGRVLSNLVGSGYRGVVYPVNPNSEAVLGIPCYPDVASLPRVPDLAVICSAAPQVPGLVRQCGEAGIMGVIIISAGFKETGEEGAALEQQIRTEAGRFPDMRIIGPNCLGIIVPSLRLNVSFAAGTPQAGHIAFISQSGALCTSVLDWAIQEKIGFSHFVSIGNSVDVTFGDLIDYFGDDDNTQSIILYIESITQARKFMAAARAFGRTKPILAYKAGRFPESAKVAASHTGAMASEDDVYDAAFQRVGVARVFDIGEIFDCAGLLGRNKIPAGAHLGIVTNAGGPGVMATDALIAAQGVLAKLSDETMDQLNESLPPSWSHGNPVDILGDANSKRLEKAARILIADPGVDALLAILTPQAMTNPTASASVIAALAETTSKPVLAAWLGGHSMTEGVQLLIDKGVPTYKTPEQAIRAFMTLVAYARNLRALYETPKEIPVQFGMDRQKNREQFLRTASEVGPILPEDASKALIESYGIATTRPYPAHSADEAVAFAQKLGFPVVLKILSPDITHKSDVGGVMLNLDDDESVRLAYQKIVSTAQSMCPEARVEGVTVQSMIDPRHGVEMIAGIKADPVFGTVMLVGMGGVNAELLNDRSLGFPPLNERLALRMLRSLRMYRLLKGYRGRPQVSIDKLIETLVRLSYLAADYPEIKELDINPLLVTPSDVVALDARVIIDPALIGNRTEQYAHLALRPYPEQYTSVMTLPDGTNITLRPIKPEDEPLWMALLGRCSKETIYSRFRYFFQWASHEVAIRYCYIDYDREIAIVAEVQEAGERQLIGVGRLVADPEHETVEFAILIEDAWQNKDLGSKLTEYCLQVARKWKLKRVMAQTTSDNRPMISVFQKLGFKVTYSDQDTTVDVVKEIAEGS